MLATSPSGEVIFRFGPWFTVGRGTAADRDRIDSSKWRTARLTARVPAPAAEIL
jgi:hypothetical protein